MNETQATATCGNQPSAINLTRAVREQEQGHAAAILWLTGLSGAGKTTLALAVEQRLRTLGCRTFILDGDHLRTGLCGDLGFSAADRQENIRRTGEVARLFFEAGIIVLAAFVSPFQADRERVRALVPAGRFFEIYCNASLAVCEERDVKGLYQKARQGKIPDFTGISSPYEVPLAPEWVVDTAGLPLAICVEQIVSGLQTAGLVPGPVSNVQFAAGG